jgi:hypothetical protein
MAVVEASVTRASGADGSGWVKRAAWDRLALHWLNAVQCVGPGDRVRTLQFGARKVVVEGDLNGGCTG